MAAELPVAIGCGVGGRAIDHWLDVGAPRLHASTPPCVGWRNAEYHLERKVGSEQKVAGLMWGLLAPTPPGSARKPCTVVWSWYAGLLRQFRMCQNSEKSVAFSGGRCFTLLSRVPPAGALTSPAPPCVGWRNAECNLERKVCTDGYGWVRIGTGGLLEYGAMPMGGADAPHTLQSGDIAAAGRFSGENPSQFLFYRATVKKISKFFTKAIDI